MIRMELNTRRDFLTLAALAEGGTLVLAVTLGWLAGIDPWAHVEWTVPAVGIGLLATTPIFLVYAFAKDTRTVAIETIGPALSLCRWYDLFVLALLAGVGEELLFRGVLQPWLSGSSAWIGFVAANVLFGLVHFVTPTYALIAGGLGMYLSLVAFHVPRANLLSAMIAHGLYDYVAFLLIVREYRTRPHNDGSYEINGAGESDGFGLATDAATIGELTVDRFDELGSPTRQPPEGTGPASSSGTDE
jgi:uncharacterized protein